MIPKSKIKSVLSRKYSVKDTDSRTLTIIGTDPKTDIREAMTLLEEAEIPVSFNDMSEISAYGEVMADKIVVVARPKKIQFMTPTGLGSSNNPSVTNRLSFAHMIHHVITKTTKPFNIIFSGNKRVELKGVTNIKYLGDGIADLRIMQGSTPVRVTVNLMEGVYHTMVEDRLALDVAHDALVSAAESGILNASIDDSDRMELYQPVALKAPRGVIRKLIMDHIRGGFGIVGRFGKESVTFDGNTNTLTIKCDRVFKSVTDLKPDDEPYLIITNSPNRKLFDINGLTVDLIPKRVLPENSTLINN